MRSVASLLLLGSSVAIDMNALPEDEMFWGRDLLKLESMSSMSMADWSTPSPTQEWPTPPPTPDWPTPSPHSDWSTPAPTQDLPTLPLTTDYPTSPPTPDRPTPSPIDWYTPAPTPDLGEAFCGNGIIEPGEECDGPGSIGEAPYECGPYSFCNDKCLCEFPEGACIDRTGVVFQGHECVAFETRACCDGGDGFNLCQSCSDCQNEVAITPQCCVDDGIADCGEEDICCPISAFGKDVKICLDSSQGVLGDPCSPDLCSAEDLDSEVNECQNCINCLESTCTEYTYCLENDENSSCVPSFLGGALNSCEQCQNACFRGSKNGPVVRRSLRGSG